MPDTDRRLGFCEVDVGIQEKSNVLVSSIQGYGESAAAILKRKGQQQVRVSLPNVKQPDGNKIDEVPPNVAICSVLQAVFLDLLCWVLRTQR